MEIEKKFLVKEVPNLENCEIFEIRQAYLSVEPVIRIRQSNDKFYLTVKGDGLISREEFELQITESQFNNLLLKIEGIIIEKKRYLVNLANELIAELDIFSGVYDGWSLVEVEFDSIEEANSFEIPNWFGEDVTEDFTYQNSYLSKKK